MPQPTWSQIHDAVQAAIVTASGLASNRVIWKYQNADAPALSYVALAFGSLTTLGIDGIVASTDLTRPAGQEVALTVKGVREVALTIEGFAASTADSNDALSLVEQVKTSLLLPSVRDQFTAVAVSPFDPQPTQHVPDVVAIGFRGRAVCTVRCYVPAPLAQELTGYIAIVKGTVTIHGGKVVDPRTVPYQVP